LELVTAFVAAFGPKLAISFADFIGIINKGKYFIFRNGSLLSIFETQFYRDSNLIFSSPLIK
jgi:hypothetical protein